MISFLIQSISLNIPAVIAISPANRDTINVRFCNQTCVDPKNDTINETKDTIALVGPTSEVAAALLIYLLGMEV